MVVVVGGGRGYLFSAHTQSWGGERERGVAGGVMGVGGAGGRERGRKNREGVGGGECSVCSYVRCRSL